MQIEPKYKVGDILEFFNWRTNQLDYYTVANITDYSYLLFPTNVETCSSTAWDIDYINSFFKPSLLGTLDRIIRHELI